MHFKLAGTGTGKGTAKLAFSASAGGLREALAAAQLSVIAIPDEQEPAIVNRPGIASGAGVGNNVIRFDRGRLDGDGELFWLDNLPSAFGLADEPVNPRERLDPGERPDDAFTALVSGEELFESWTPINSAKLGEVCLAAAHSNTLPPVELSAALAVRARSIPEVMVQASDECAALCSECISGATLNRTSVAWESAIE